MSHWTGKKTVVTGAGGFIGSHLAERLVEAGADVRAVIHYNSLGSWGWLEQSSARREMEIVAGDVTDPDSMRAAVEGCEIVFHLAALIAIPYSYRAPTSYIRTNIEGTLNVLQASREAAVERLIHTSTSEVYGTAQYVPIDEKHPLRGQSPYSASKIGADKMAEAFYRSFDLAVVTVRPFNTFGPRQSARAVIPTVITQCLAGKTVRLGNLAASRDLNFVSDTVDGYLLAGSRPDVAGQTFNLGTGHEITVGDLARLIGKLSGRDLTLEADEARLRPEKSEVDRLLADSTLAQRLLGWHPRVTLEEGLASTIEWMRQHLDRYRPDVYVV